MIEHTTIIDRIKTFANAYTELKHTHPYVRQFENLLNTDLLSKRLANDLFAYMKLRIICTALNEGWKADLKNEKETLEYIYIPNLIIKTQKEINELEEARKTKPLPKEPVLKLRQHEKEDIYYKIKCNVTTSFPIIKTSSLLYLKNEELAVYCGKQFIDVWAEFYLPYYITSKLKKVFI